MVTSFSRPAHPLAPLLALLSKYANRLRARRRAHALGLGTLLLVLGVAAQGWAGDTFPGAKWTVVSSPDGAGWSAARLKEADDFARTLHTDAYVIVEGGVMVHEYGATALATNVYSVRKSVLSVLMGIHVDRGVVNLDKTLADVGVDDTRGLSETERQATVRQLLQARSGVYHPAAYETPQMAAERPARHSFKPGEHWYYNNWDFNALATIFKTFTGKTVFESLRDDLVTPLQFEDFTYAADTRFHFEAVSVHPAYVMRLSARDLARVGLLMARNGRWGDRQVVSAKWVTESTTSYSTAGPGVGYGYLWWVGLDRWHFLMRFPGAVYSARGNLGQVVVVDPVRDLVIVHRVHSDQPGRRSVSNKQFAELLERIMAARSSDADSSRPPVAGAR